MAAAKPGGGDTGGFASSANSLRAKSSPSSYSQASWWGAGGTRWPRHTTPRYSNWRLLWLHALPLPRTISGRSQASSA